MMENKPNKEIISVPKFADRKEALVYQRRVLAKHKHACAAIREVDRLPDKGM